VADLILVDWIYIAAAAAAGATLRLASSSSSYSSRCWYSWYVSIEQISQASFVSIARTSLVEDQRASGRVWRHAGRAGCLRSGIAALGCSLASGASWCVSQAVSLSTTALDQDQHLWV
jgi:hypothetical protein